MNQVITFSADLTADSASRTVSGKIVPLNVEAGSTNMGKVIFASGSIAIEDPKAIKLLSQHGRSGARKFLKLPQVAQLQLN